MNDSYLKRRVLHLTKVIHDIRDVALVAIIVLTYFIGLILLGFGIGILLRHVVG